MKKRTSSAPRSISSLTDSTSELLRDARGRQRGEMRLDVLGEHHQVAQLMGAIAYVIGQQRLRLEAERPEHPDQRRLVRDHVDHELRELELHRLPDSVASELAAD